MVSLHRTLASAVGRVLLAAAAGFTVLGAVQSIRSVFAAGALVALGPLWIALGTLDQRTATRLSANGRHRLTELELAFAARADVTVLLGVGWLASGWIGLLTAAITAAR